MVFPCLESTLKTTFSSCKVLANSSNSLLPAFPDQSTNHIALAYRQAIRLVIVKRFYFFFLEFLPFFFSFLVFFYLFFYQSF
ncbi:hypothetical protein ES731_15140 [Psychroflexus gondwanensis]|nr:hypothetical protein ES731_15140 [Psychroflexus gondwanensis]